jgi:hypothetical protein
LVLFLITSIYPQTFRVSGNISDNLTPIKYASITFIDQNDTTKKYPALTDAQGNYQINLITSVRNNNIEPPKSFELEQNYPNPFSSSTSIPYNLNKQSEITVRIFDILGREVKQYKVGMQTYGRHEILWNGTDNFSRKVASGIYFYQVQSGSDVKVKKMIFGISNKELNSSIPLQLNKLSNKKEQNRKIYSNTFITKITNCDSTFPQIYPAQFSDIIIANDTTINFEVKKLEYSICYNRVDTLWQNPDGTYYWNWELYVNNLNGNMLRDISNHMPTDNSRAAWSPDGKYISFINSTTHLYIYDVLKDTLMGVIASGNEIAASALWSPDSKKIVCTYQSTTQPVGTYIMDVDGSNKRKLKYDVTYFYKDGYHTLYLISYSSKVDSVFLSNLDGTQNEFVVNLYDFVSTHTGGVRVYDFDPDNNELLLSFDDPSTALPNVIAKYNITQRRLDTVAVSDSGSKYYRPKYSNDFKKIAVVEVQFGNVGVDSVTTYKISLFEGGIKSTLLEFKEPGVFLDFNLFSFSHDDKYFAFTKNVQIPAYYDSWNSYLYVIKLDTKQVTYVDTGISPIWNPLLPH